MATGVGNFFKYQVGSTEISIPASTFKALLYSTGYIAHSTLREDLAYILDAADSSKSAVAYELSTDGGGYARVTVGARTLTEIDARNVVSIDSSDITFSSVSSSAGTAGGCAIFAELAASDSSGRILATYYDFATPVTPNGGDIVVQLSTGGWLELLASTSDASA